MLKYLCLFLTLLAVSKAVDLSETEKNILKQFQEECIKESGVDRNIILNIVKNKEYVDDPKLKEHIFCYNKKIFFQKDNGEINKEFMTARFMEKFHDKDGVEKAIKTCCIMKETPVDTAYEMIKCLHQIAPDHFSVEWSL